MWENNEHIKNMLRENKTPIEILNGIVRSQAAGYSQFADCIIKLAKLVNSNGTDKDIYTQQSRLYKALISGLNSDRSVVSNNVLDMVYISYLDYVDDDKTVCVLPKLATAKASDLWNMTSHVRFVAIMKLIENMIRKTIPAGFNFEVLLSSIDGITINANTITVLKNYVNGGAE